MNNNTTQLPAAPVRPENPLTANDTGPRVILDRTRQVLSKRHAFRYIDGFVPDEDHEMGEHWLDWMVIDALKYAEALLASEQRQGV